MTIRHPRVLDKGRSTRTRPGVRSGQAVPVLASTPGAEQPAVGWLDVGTGRASWFVSHERPRLTSAATANNQSRHLLRACRLLRYFVNQCNQDIMSSPKMVSNFDVPWGDAKPSARHTQGNRERVVFGFLWSSVGPFYSSHPVVSGQVSITVNRSSEYPPKCLWRLPSERACQASSSGQ